MKHVMNYHMIAFFVGFLLDLAFGDPYCLPHPIRLIGKLITGTEKILCGTGIKGKDKKADNHRTQFRRGIGLALIVMVSVAAAASFLLLLAYRLHPVLGVAVECVMTYQILAAKCLKIESMKVYHFLKNGNLEQARKAVSMIVGRDTEHLDEEGVAKAAVETVAENTSDGVIAPMLYLAAGGPIL